MPKYTDNAEITRGIKEHRCTWCGEPIEKGIVHLTWTTRGAAWGGVWTRHRMHRECGVVADKELIPGQVYIFYSRDRASSEDAKHDLTLVLTRRSRLEERASTIFICRMQLGPHEARNAVVRKAKNLCMQHDLALMKQKLLKLRQTPVLDDYTTQLEFPGSPAVLRPIDSTTQLQG